jgi:hypothetical protein
VIVHRWSSASNCLELGEVVGELGMAMAGKAGLRCRSFVVVAVALAAILTVVAAGAAARAEGRPARWGRGGELAAGQVGSRSAVPWRRVGAGWVLAEFWPGRLPFAGKGIAAAAMLYLIDPAGGRYRLYRWAATKSPDHLVDWSGDKSRALLQSTTGGALEQVVLATGAVSRFRVPGNTLVIGYTRPGGRGLLGGQRIGSRLRLARYSLSGRLSRVLASGGDVYSAVSSGSGAVLAVPGAQGVRLVSSDGGVIRTLRVPGTARPGCFPSRWWNSVTILAYCYAKGAGYRARLWLVPASGASPAPLTPQRGRVGRDHGDIGAWRLPGGLYLQAIGSSGNARIFRQAAGGPVTPVTVPRTAGDDLVLASRGGRLLVAASNLCAGSTSLAWFSPSTRREQVLIRPPRGRAGLFGAVPYGQPTAPIFIQADC